MCDLGHIAIVEDDPGVADALASYACSAGYSCSTFHTAESFLESLQTEETPDCLIVDLYLPGMSGADVVNQLRDGIAAIPAVALTAWPQNAEQELATLPDNVDVYVKPIDGARLIEHVDELIKSRPPSRNQAPRR